VGKQQGEALEDYVLDPAGHIISVHNNLGTRLRTELYVPGERHMATANWNTDGTLASFNLNHADWLGTERLRTDLSGNYVQSCTDTPYGMNLACTTPPSDLSPMHFTGKQRDGESGLDYFGARYYASNMGRWMSPDWSASEEPVPYSKLDNPQTLNLYSYVVNNPLAQIDDDGHDIIFVTSGPGALMNEQTVRDSVTALLANPNTNGYLQQFVGTAPGTLDLVIANGDLSAGDSKTIAPDGTPGTSTVQGNTDPNITTDGKSGGPIITIDNRTTADETPGVLTHEAVHAGESQKNPAQFAKDAKAEAANPCHDCRPQEQRAIAVQKAQGPAIAKAVKQIQKQRKQEQKKQKQKQKEQPN
jgi:RHS repeat-associated protein